MSYVALWCVHSVCGMILRGGGEIVCAYFHVFVLVCMGVSLSVLKCICIVCAHHLLMYVATSCVGA